MRYRKLGKLVAVLAAAFCWPGVYPALSLAQPAGGAAAAAVSATEPEPLRTGEPVRRALAVGEVHAFSVQLPAERTVKLRLEREGVAAVLTVLAPDGSKLGTFGSASSSRGKEEISFVAESGGSYRVEVRTFFKPSPPGRYRLALADIHPTDQAEKLAQAKRSCRGTDWLDSDGNFLVNRALVSISDCLGAVAHSLAARYPDAAGKANDAKSDLGYLASRWRWGEFVSPAYQQSLTEDFRALAESLDQPDPRHVLAVVDEVVRDVKVKADHCRKSSRGFGGDVKVNVVTRKGGAEVKELFVFYKRCLYKYSRLAPNRFGKLSPVSSTLPPSVYLMWAGKSEQAPALEHEPACFPVQGEQEQQIDISAP